jgi:uncharacterized Zn finger protein
MAEPVCPTCGIEGVGHIVSRDSEEKSRTKQAWFVIVHCDACGHVYNVLAKHVFTVPVTPPLSLPKAD